MGISPGRMDGNRGSASRSSCLEIRSRRISTGSPISRTRPKRETVRSLSFPAAGRILALRGCDIIACPAAIKQRFSTPHAGSQVAQRFPIPTGADPHHWHHFRVRAGENNVFFAFANILDPENGYPGLSGVFGPDTFEFPPPESIVP